MSFFKPEDFCEKAPPNDKDCPHGVGNDWCGGVYLAGRANAKRDAEIERLREIEASWSGTVDNAERLANQVARLEADNARLREALEEIVYSHEIARQAGHACMLDCDKPARAALDGEGQ